MRANTIFAAGLALLVGLVIAGCGSSGSSDSTSGGSGSPPPNFSISLSQTSGTVLVGSNLSGSVQASAPAGFTGSVTLSASNLPAGVTAVFNPPTISLPGAGSSTFTLVVPASTAPVAGHAVTILASGTGIDSQALFSLTVQTGTSPSAGFQLDLSTASLGLAPGGSADATLTLTAQGGFAGTVTLALAGLPSGVTATFTPASPALGTTPVSVAVHLSADALAAVTTTPVTVNLSAQGSGSSQSAPLTVSVLSPSDPVVARSAALNAVKDYYATLLHQGSSDLDAATAVAAFMTTRPEFASSGVDAEIISAWGIMKDGATVIVANNWQFSPPGAATAASLSLASATMNQPVSKAALSFLGAGLPVPPYARLMHSFQFGTLSPEAITDGYDGGPTIAAIKGYLSGKGYNIRAGAETSAVINSLKTVEGDGFFFFSAHGGGGDAPPPAASGELMYAVSTSNPQSLLDDIIYADDIRAGRVVYFVSTYGNFSKDATGKWQPVTETRYGITSKFVDTYMSFAPDSVAMLMACKSGKRPKDFVDHFTKKGVGAVVSATELINAEFGYTASRYLVDRLLGANEFRPEAPPQRPFPADLVWADMAKKNLLNDTWTDGQHVVHNNNLVLTLKDSARPPILSPSIQSLAVSEKDEKLTLVGFFGDKIAGAKITADDWPLNCPDWTPGKIVCDLPAPGSPGSKGKVVVELPGGASPRQSNPRWLTQWDIPLKYTWTDPLDYKGWKYDVAGTLRFRADVGNYRVEPGKPPTFPVRGMALTKDSFLTITASGATPKGSCTDTVTGTGTFRPWVEGNGALLVVGLMKVDTLTQQGALVFYFGASQIDEPFSHTITGPAPCFGSSKVPAPLLGTLDTIIGTTSFPSPLEGSVDPSDPAGTSFAPPASALNVTFDTNFNLLGKSFSKANDYDGTNAISWPAVAHQPAELQGVTTPR